MSMARDNDSKCSEASLQNISADILALAKKQGADFADIYAYRSTALSTTIRHGNQEHFEREEDLALGLRVFKGRASACLSSSDLRPEMLSKLVDQALSMAKHVPEDQDAQFPTQPFSSANVNLVMHDTQGEPSVSELNDSATKMEEIGLAHKGITNSEGADTSWSSTQVCLANSNGFQGGYTKTSASASISLIGGEGTNMERDYAYDYTTSWADLDGAEKIANLAAKRTLEKLNPHSGKTGTFPVLYDQRVSSSLVRHVLAGINGGRIAKGTSFLNDMMGQQIMPHGMTIHDNPHLDSMPKSRPFDAEGQENNPMQLVEDGVLNNWIMDLRSAHKLGLSSNGRASRSLSSQPSPASSNVWLESSEAVAFDDLVADIQDGFYVTELLGSSVSLTTGDYSRGASGFWIEAGKIAYPVSEITIAGNLKEMLLSMTAANDMRHRYGCDTPSLLIAKMSIASAT
jgi:PmbA protein